MLQAQVPANYLSVPAILKLTVTNTISLGAAVSAGAIISVVTSGGHGTIDGVATVSVAGGLGDGNSALPSVSYDGRYVVFSSQSGNLTPLGTNGHSQLYIRDTCRNAPLPCTSQTSLLSVAADGSLANGDNSELIASASYPSVNATGRFIAFRSVATNLVQPQTNGKQQIFLRDSCIGASGCVPSTTLISANNAGEQGDGDSRDPVISETGRFVAFTSNSTNMSAGAGGQYNQVYVRDTCFGANIGCTPNTVLISVTPLNQPGNRNSEYPSISADGRYIAFGSASTDIVPNAYSGNLYIRDTCYAASAGCTTRTVLASQNAANPNGTTGDLKASLSSDGRYLAYLAASQVFTSSGIVNTGVVGLVLRDTCLEKQNCTPSLISLDNGSAGAPSLPQLSNDASVVLYLSQPPAGMGFTSAVACRTSNAPCTDSRKVISYRPDGNMPNGSIGPSAIAGDGHSAAITSAAPDIVPGTTGNNRVQVLTSPTTY